MTVLCQSRQIGRFDARKVGCRRGWDGVVTGAGLRLIGRKVKTTVRRGIPTRADDDEHRYVPTAPTYPAMTVSERRTLGAVWRERVPLQAHAEWRPPADRPDPVEILIEQGKSRIPELLPVRYARMKTDAFAFLRGAAAIMARDLASGPATGLRLQVCGDCHLANFGAYASPEGTPVFDVNDFDETLPAPFEWDVKRLAASLAVAGRVAKLPDRECRGLARMATKSYRRRLGELARLSPLDAWSSHIDLDRALDAVNSE